METSSKLKINHSEDIRHQVHIVDVPLSSFKKKRENYILKIRRKYTNQKAVVKIMLGASIIENKQRISGSFYTISFDDEGLYIFIEKPDADRELIKRFGKYRISYLSDDTDELSIKVKVALNKYIITTYSFHSFKKLKRKNMLRPKE